MESKDSREGLENDSKTESKSPPRKGRRERQEDNKGEEVGNGTMAFNTPVDNITAAVADASISDTPGQKPRRKAAADGNNNNQELAAANNSWMNTSNSSSTQSNNKKKIFDDEPVQIAQNKDKYFQDKDDEILLIPELDEDGSSSDQKVAHAPRNVNRRMPSLAELDSDVHGYSSILYNQNELDLGVLMRSLVPPHLLDDTDRNAVWTFDSLLREITDELVSPDKIVKAINIPAESSRQLATSFDSSQKQQQQLQHSPNHDNNRGSESKRKSGGGSSTSPSGRTALKT